MPPRRSYSIDQQFPLKPLDQHHDLATWHRRSEAALLLHYSDTDHMNRMRSLMGIDPLPTVPRQTTTLGPKGVNVTTTVPPPTLQVPPGWDRPVDPQVLQARRDQLMADRARQRRRDDLMAQRYEAPAPAPAQAEPTHLAPDQGPTMEPAPADFAGLNAKAD